MIKIVENYTGPDSWYRKYSNGWIEQGGYVAKTFSTDSAYAYTFPIPFVSEPITFRTTVYAPRSSDSSGNGLTIKSSAISNTGVTFINDGYGTNKQGFYWEASGF